MMMVGVEIRSSLCKLTMGSLSEAVKIKAPGSISRTQESYLFP